MKKRYKVIIILQSIIIFLFVCYIGLVHVYNEILYDNDEYFRAQYENVKIYEVGKPIFFSCSTVKIRYEDYIFETTIANDGARLTEDNFEIVKNDDYYEVTLKGCEQKDITYYLKCKEETN